MPTMPPNMLKIAEENERKPAPHNSGMRLPIVDPMNTPIQIKGRGFMS